MFYSFSVVMTTSVSLYAYHSFNIGTKFYCNPLSHFGLGVQKNDSHHYVEMIVKTKNVKSLGFSVSNCDSFTFTFSTHADEECNNEDPS